MTEPLERELAAMLAKEQSALNTLMTTLEDEQLALKDRNLDSMRQTAQRKQQHLSEFNRLVQDRLSYLSTHDQDASESGFESLLGLMPRGANVALTTQWQQLKTDFEHALLLNEKNGQLIHNSQARNRTLLSILQGQRNQPNLYNQKGSSKGSSSQHKIGKA